MRSTDIRDVFYTAFPHFKNDTSLSQFYNLFALAYSLSIVCCVLSSVCQFGSLRELSLIAAIYSTRVICEQLCCLLAIKWARRMKYFSEFVNRSSLKFPSGKATVYAFFIDFGSITFGSSRGMCGCQNLTPKESCFIHIKYPKIFSGFHDNWNIIPNILRDLNFI